MSDNQGMANHIIQQIFVTVYKSVLKCKLRLVEFEIKLIKILA